MELPFSQFLTKLYNFSWQQVNITKGCAYAVGSDSTLMTSFSMTSQHSSVSSVCDLLAHWHIPDTDASLMPRGWHGMLVGFLAKLLPGLHQVLAACQLVWSLSQPSVHFVPHVVDWRQIGWHRGPSHHQHILMSEKIHDEMRNAWSSIVLLKGHVPSLTTEEGQHVRSNNLLQVAVCIQIAINNDQDCLAMGWDATPHHHTVSPDPVWVWIPGP